jgi:hypothetical protein
MKKLILSSLFTLSFLITAPFIINTDACKISRYCGSVGTIECEGDSCVGSFEGATNPWVKCDGKKNYCYENPAPPTIE